MGMERRTRLVVGTRPAHWCTLPRHGNQLRTTFLCIVDHEKATESRSQHTESNNMTIAPQKGKTFTLQSAKKALPRPLVVLVSL